MAYTIRPDSVAISWQDQPVQWAKAHQRDRGLEFFLTQPDPSRAAREYGTSRSRVSLRVRPPSRPSPDDALLEHCPDIAEKLTLLLTVCQDVRVVSIPLVVGAHIAGRRRWATVPSPYSLGRSLLGPLPIALGTRTYLPYILLRYATP